MKQLKIFAFCTLLLKVTTQIEAKSYRKDYQYDARTDTFYKLHVDSDSKLQRKQLCELEGAELMSPMSEQELLQARASINEHQSLTEEDGNSQQNVAAEPIIDYSEAKDVLEMSCQVTARGGHVKTSSVFRNKPFFICKIKAKDVSYNSQCRVYAKGYRFVPSVRSCYKIPRVAYTWHQAAVECQAEGAHLAVINSAQEARELQTIAHTAAYVPESYDMSYMHIGFRAVKVTEPRIFRTIFNETLQSAGYNEWARNEPDNGWGGQEHCGSLYRATGKLNDIRCHAQYTFICEKEVTSSETSL